MTFAPETIHPDTWPTIHMILKPAIDRRDDDSTVASLIDELLANEAQLWVKREGGDPIAAAVSELVRTPRGYLVHGRLLAGKGMALWIDELIACITDHARQIGAVGISITGRKGWTRVLGARGWRERAVIMECQL